MKNKYIKDYHLGSEYSYKRALFKDCFSKGNFIKKMSFFPKILRSLRLCETRRDINTHTHTGLSTQSFLTSHTESQRVRVLPILTKPILGRPFTVLRNVRHMDSGGIGFSFKKLLVVYSLNSIFPPRGIKILSTATVLLKVLVDNVLLHEVVNVCSNPVSRRKY